MAVQVDHGVAGHAAVAVLVVLVAAGVDAAAVVDVHAQAGLFGEVVLEAQLDIVAGDAGDVVALADLNVAVAVGAGVVR